MIRLRRTAFEFASGEESPPVHRARSLIERGQAGSHCSEITAICFFSTNVVASFRRGDGFLQSGPTESPGRAARLQGVFVRSQPDSVSIHRFAIGSTVSES